MPADRDPRKLFALDPEGYAEAKPCERPVIAIDRTSAEAIGRLRRKINQGGPDDPMERAESELEDDRGARREEQDFLRDLAHGIHSTVS